MKKDVREFIRRLEAVGLTLESTPGHYRRPARRRAASPSERDAAVLDAAGAADDTGRMATEMMTTALESFALPGEAVFPESIGIDKTTGDVYVDSLADGAIYRLRAVTRPKCGRQPGRMAEARSPASRSTGDGGCGPPAATRAPSLFTTRRSGS